MSIINTKSNRIVLKNAKSMFIMPYVYDSTVGDYVLGDDIYDISAIIGDSITLEQEDGETQSKENEYTGETIVENVTSGKYAFTAQCLDLQNAVLRVLFGAYYNSSVGIAALRSDYITMYAMIKITFSERSAPDVYLPKVSLNSKLLMSQLKTRGSQGNINGTALPHVCSVIKSTPSGSTAGQFEPLRELASNSNIYQVDTPVLFVPKDKTPVFLHSYTYSATPSSEVYNFDEAVFSGSTNHNCSRNRITYGSALSKYVISYS